MPSAASIDSHCCRRKSTAPAKLPLPTTPPRLPLPCPQRFFLDYILLASDLCHIRTLGFEDFFHVHRRLAVPWSGVPHGLLHRSFASPSDTTSGHAAGGTAASSPHRNRGGGASRQLRSMCRHCRRLNGRVGNSTVQSLTKQDKTCEPLPTYTYVTDAKAMQHLYIWLEYSVSEEATLTKSSCYDAQDMLCAVLLMLEQEVRELAINHGWRFKYKMAAI